jgi:hypothetical protein
MSRVREVTPKVLEILKEHPETRSDDKELIIKVYVEKYNVSPLLPFGVVMRRKGLPSFESIRRARQRIQAYCEDLRAEEPVESIRIAEQEDYIKYSREEIPV